MAKTDRCVVRNEAYQKKSISIRERHNERKNQDYSNPDIVKDRANLNVHFKSCAGTYEQEFDRMVAEGEISTRGLKADAKVFDELVFDVNSAYFENNGGYEYAQEFFAEAYKLAVKEAGGEQYILSAVMHADERNRALSEQMSRDVFHYHLHVVYVPVVDKEIKWSKRCKDPALVGTIKETIKQVSHSKKWPRFKDERGAWINSYSLLQDRFFEHMQTAGFTDFERGERGSTAEHLSVLDYKIQQDENRVAVLAKAISDKENTAASLNKQMEKNQKRLSGLQDKIAGTKQAVSTYFEIENMTKKSLLGKIEVSPTDWETVSNLAKEGLVSRGNMADLKQQLASAKKEIGRLKSTLDRLLEETWVFREAVKHEPKRVIEMLQHTLRQHREQREAEQATKKKSKDYER